MCNKTDTWIHPLADLGYDVHLIEQTIALTKVPGHVKPDVVVYSRGLLHCIAFDCKGGTTVEASQLERYQNLESKDFLNSIFVYNPPQFSSDVCYVSLERNHDILSKKIGEFPSLVFDTRSLKKSGHFTKVELDKTFKNEIQIEADMEEPLSYYPFSETDDRGLIVKEVLRAIITILTDRRRKGFNIFDKATYRNDEILRTIHQMYDALSVEHRAVLMDKVIGIIDHLRIKYPSFYAQVLKLQEKDSNSLVQLSNLIEICEKIAVKEEGEFRLDGQ